MAGLMGAVSAEAEELSRDAVPDPARLRFRAIAVDASRVARLGRPSTAAALERQLGRDAGEVFADLMTPGDARAPRLLLRIDSIELASYVGGGPILSRDAASTDYLEGAGLVMSGTHVLSTTPMLSALNASYSGAWTLPDIDERRVAAISHHFVSWLRRQMGL